MNDTSSNDPSQPEARSSGSPVLIGFAVIVLVLLALMLNNPEKVAELGHRFFGWQTPKEKCITNLKHIDGAVQQWALENRKFAADTVSLSDTSVLAYLRRSALPTCPLGGKYSAGANVAAAPRCSIPGHTL
jgi:hypothetical protein